MSAEKYREKTYKLFLIAPAIAVVLFVAAPLVYLGYLSLREFNLILDINRFVGLKTYLRTLKDVQFFRVLGNNLLYTIVALGGQFTIGLSMALLVFHLKSRLTGVLAVTLSLPLLLMPVSAALCWRLVMYAPPYAEFNRMFYISTSKYLLSYPQTVLWAVILVDIWAWSPWVYLPLLGALHSLPKSQMEAAKMDGASFMQVVRHVTLPMMKPVILVVLSINLIGIFRTFNYVQVMTGGGPANSSHVLSTYIYQETFSLLAYGRGASMCVMMLFISMAMCMGFLHFSGALKYAQ